MSPWLATVFQVYDMALSYKGWGHITWLCIEEYLLPEVSLMLI